MTHGYNDRPLFKNVNLTIEKGERIAIIGPNGAGKSTLLRLLMGREECISGHIGLGEHSIVPNYFEQNQAEALDLNSTVLDTLVQASPDAKVSDLKALLGRMLFSGNSVDKKVRCAGHCRPMIIGNSVVANRSCKSMRRFARTLMTIASSATNLLACLFYSNGPLSIVGHLCPGFEIMSLRLNMSCLRCINAPLRRTPVACRIAGLPQSVTFPSARAGVVALTNACSAPMLG